MLINELIWCSLSALNSSMFAQGAFMKNLFLFLSTTFLIQSVYSRIPERNFKGDILGQAKESLYFSADDLWHFLNPKENDVEGVSVTKTYNKYKVHSASNEIVVAVIDSGVDVRHKDLQGKIWVNKGEVWNNGIDDDENGYIDDVFGWNFIGNKKGMAKITDDDNNPENGFSYEMGDAKYQVDKDTFELTRELKRMRALAQSKPLSAEEEAYLNLLEETYSRERGNSNDTYFDLNFDSRLIVGDDYSDQKQSNYGNNDVIGNVNGAFHGTHVSGIIAAERTNGDVAKGIATKVKIMCLRAVPDGDERDKDIANAIKYAVSNGAKIINMSFGKGYNFNKKIVDEAVEYAESKGVILVHAAGNSTLNNDLAPNFPNRRNSLEGKKNNEFSNWIEVGASNSSETNLTAYFSNYGKKTVDLFAPGVQILSLAPENRYAPASGTSMASPVVAGVLAAIFNFVPSASPSKIKDALLSSVRKYPDLVIFHANQNQNFSDLSITGGVADLFEAVTELKKQGFDVELNNSSATDKPSKKWGKF